MMGAEDEISALAPLPISEPPGTLQAATMGAVKGRTVVLVALAVLGTVGLTACGGSSWRSEREPTTQAIVPKPFSDPSVPKAFSDLPHPHKYTLNEVKAAFANQRIGLRGMRTPYGAHVVVLFDPRWHAPTGFHLDGGPPSHTYIWVFVHASAGASEVVQDGNVYVANGSGEGRSVNTALQNLERSFKQ